MATKSCPPPLRDPGELDMEHRRRKATAVKPGIIKFTAALLSITATPTSAFFLLPPFRLPLCNVHPRGSTSTMMAYDVRYSPNRWRDGGDIVPGVGGVWPGDPNAKTYHVTYVNKEGVPVASVDVPVDRYIYFATEDSEVDVPIVNKKRMCRNGCCTTCAVKVLEGKVKAEGALGLLKELKAEGYALTCCSYPKSDLVLELQAEDEVYMRQFGDDFEAGGVEWGGVFLDDD